MNLGILASLAVPQAPDSRWRGFPSSQQKRRLCLSMPFYSRFQKPQYLPHRPLLPCLKNYNGTQVVEQPLASRTAGFIPE